MTESRSQSKRTEAAHSFQKSSVITAMKSISPVKTVQHILHTGTRLAERTIQSLTNLMNANLEHGINLRCSLEKALHVLRFTIHSEIQKTAFKLQIRLKARTRLTHLKTAFSADSKTCPSTLHGVHGRNHRPFGDVEKEN